MNADNGNYICDEVELTPTEYIELHTHTVPSKCYYFGSEYVTYDECKAECDSLDAQMPW